MHKKKKENLVLKIFLHFVQNRSKRKKYSPIIISIMKQIFLNEKFMSVENITGWIRFAALFMCLFGFYANIMRIIALTLSVLLAIMACIALYQVKHWHVANAENSKKFLTSYYKGQIWLNTGIALICVVAYLPLSANLQFYEMLVGFAVSIVGLVYLTRYYKLRKTI